MQKQHGRCSRTRGLLAVDETLKALVAVPSRQPLEEMRALFSSRQSAIEAMAQRFRLFYT
jgi:hypothetical protein